MPRRIARGLIGLFLLLAAGTALGQFDSQHQAWTALLSKHELADAPEHQKAVRDGTVEIRYLDYDWRLNDARS